MGSLDTVIGTSSLITDENLSELQYMGPVQGVVQGGVHRGPSSVEAWAQGEKPARMGDQTLVLLPLPLHIAHGPVLPDLTGYHRQGTLALFLDPQPFLRHQAALCTTLYKAGMCYCTFFSLFPGEKGAIHRSKGKGMEVNLRMNVKDLITEDGKA